MHGLRYKVSQSSLALFSLPMQIFLSHYSKGAFSKEQSPLYLVNPLPPWRERADAMKHHLMKWTQPSESAALDYADDLDLAGLEADTLLSEKQYKAKAKTENRRIRQCMKGLRQRLYNQVHPISVNTAKRGRLSAWGLLVMYLSAYTRLPVRGLSMRIRNRFLEELSEVLRTGKGRDKQGKAMELPYKEIQWLRQVCDDNLPGYTWPKEEDCIDILETGKTSSTVDDSSPKRRRRTWERNEQRISDSMETQGMAPRKRFGQLIKTRAAVQDLDADSDAEHEELIPSASSTTHSHQLTPASTEKCTVPETKKINSQRLSEDSQAQSQGELVAETDSIKKTQSLQEYLQETSKEEVAQLMQRYPMKIKKRLWQSNRQAETPVSQGRLLLTTNWWSRIVAVKSEPMSPAAETAEAQGERREEEKKPKSKAKAKAKCKGKPRAITSIAASSANPAAPKKVFAWGACPHCQGPLRPQPRSTIVKGRQCNLKEDFVMGHLWLSAVGHRTKKRNADPRTGEICVFQRSLEDWEVAKYADYQKAKSLHNLKSHQARQSKIASQ